MRNQALLVTNRLATINKTLAEIEDYLNALTNELATTALTTEEKVDTFAAIGHARESIEQLRDTLNKTKNRRSQAGG